MALDGGVLWSGQRLEVCEVQFRSEWGDCAATRLTAERGVRRDPCRLSIVNESFDDLLRRCAARNGNLKRSCSETDAALEVGTARRTSSVVCRLPSVVCRLSPDSVVRSLTRRPPAADPRGTVSAFGATVQADRQPAHRTTCMGPEAESTAVDGKKKGKKKWRAPSTGCHPGCSAARDWVHRNRLLRRCQQKDGLCR